MVLTSVCSRISKSCSGETSHTTLTSTVLMAPRTLSKCARDPANLRGNALVARERIEVYTSKIMDMEVTLQSLKRQRRTWKTFVHRYETYIRNMCEQEIPLPEGEREDALEFIDGYNAAVDLINDAVRKYSLWRDAGASKTSFDEARAVMEDSPDVLKHFGRYLDYDFESRTHLEIPRMDNAFLAHCDDQCYLGEKLMGDATGDGALGGACEVDDDRALGGVCEVDDDTEDDADTNEVNACEDFCGRIDDADSRSQEQSKLSVCHTFLSALQEGTEEIVVELLGNTCVQSEGEDADFDRTNEDDEAEHVPLKLRKYAIKPNGRRRQPRKQPKKKKRKSNDWDSDGDYEPTRAVKKQIRVEQQQRWREVVEV